MDNFYLILGWLCAGFIALGSFATTVWMLLSIDIGGGYALITAIVTFLLGGFSIFAGIVCFGPDKEESYDY
jgi:hypothetical protein